MQAYACVGHYGFNAKIWHRKRTPGHKDRRLVGEVLCCRVRMSTAAFAQAHARCSPYRCCIHMDAWNDLELSKCMSFLTTRIMPYWYVHISPFQSIRNHFLMLSADFRQAKFCMSYQRHVLTQNCREPSSRSPCVSKTCCSVARLHLLRWYLLPFFVHRIHRLRLSSNCVIFDHPHLIPSH